MPGFVLLYFGPVFGSAASYLTTILLIIYFFISKPWQKPVVPIIIFTLLYFLLSSLNYNGDEIYFLKEFLRFFILIICITQVMYDSSYRDIFYILLIGGISVIINGLVFPETNVIYHLVRGRYAGFLLNPNTAGIVCLLGMALSYSINNKLFKLLGQAIFTFAGILTLSRTFIAVWVVINLFAIFKDRKNLLAPIIGTIAVTVMITFTNSKNFASDRFDAFTSFFVEGEVKTKTLNNDTRDKTWALYYDLIFKKPILGHGYNSFQLQRQNLPGVHNSYLMVIGESGILPFILFIGFYLYLLKNSIGHFYKEPYLTYTILVILLNLMVSHTFFTNYQSLALSIFVFLRIREIKDKKNNLEHIKSN